MRTLILEEKTIKMTAIARIPERIELIPDLLQTCKDLVQSDT